MTGTILNAAGILAGGIAGLTVTRQLSPAAQVALKGYAKEKFSRASATSSRRLSEGFITCTLLFCVGPIAIVGALQDGLEGKWETLAIKAVMDGLATMAFVTTFGWGVMLSVIPVVAYQGTITLSARFLGPLLEERGLIDSLNATGGMLVFCIALVILELKKIELADYLPSLAFAPLLTWLLTWLLK